MWKAQDEIFRTKGSKVRKNITGNGRIIGRNEGVPGNWPGKWHQMQKGMKKKKKRVTRKMKEAYVKT